MELSKWKNIAEYKKDPGITGINSIFILFKMVLSWLLFAEPAFDYIQKLLIYNLSNPQ